ncbi:MAG: OsmC family protein [Pirellulaceae bacterium]|nr:OsmC family protein [Pirellulaceae bacterium]
MNLDEIKPDRMFDGGDLDCGSGLVLLLRENMLEVPVDGILEMRSREATVADDLPPWCRMTGHEYLGALPGAECMRYFLRRGQPTKDEEKALDEDKERAKTYEWRARSRSTGHLKSTVYFRNFSFDVGQPASFEEKDVHPSAVEYLLAALAGALSTGFATECAKDGLEIDDIEISIKGNLDNVLAHLGIEDGDPSFKSIQLKCFASTLDDAEKVRAAWQRTFDRSPLAQTLRKAVELEAKLAIV